MRTPYSGCRPVYNLFCFHYNQKQRQYFNIIFDDLVKSGFSDGAIIFINRKKGFIT